MTYENIEGEIQNDRQQIALQNPKITIEKTKLSN